MRFARLTVLATLALALLAAPLAAEAQLAGKVYRIGWLDVGAPESVELKSFRKALEDLGYVEGRNIVVEYRGAERKLERLPDLAQELIRLKPDVIATRGLAATLALKDATSTIPIVMGAQDPVASGLVASLARPGGNITGLAFGPELAAKRLALIKETVPSLRRVGVLRNPANPRQMAPQIEETERAAQSLGVQLQIVDWDGSDGAFRAMVRQRAEAVIVMGTRSSSTTGGGGSSNWRARTKSRRSTKHGSTWRQGVSRATAGLSYG
jgi:putative ABC transport system substrate-binding protein